MRELFEEFGHGSLSRLPPHRNPGLEITYLKHGHLVWQCEGKPEPIRPDSLYFTLPWQEHGSVAEFEPGHEWFFVVIRLQPLPAGPASDFSFPSALGIDPKTTQIIRSLLVSTPRHGWPATPLAGNLIPALVQELTAPGPLHSQRVSHLTAQVILELGSILSHPDAATPNTDDDRLSALISDLERRCEEPWTLAKMAAQLSLKRTQFTNLFHHYTGDSPLHYLQRMRITRACRLLRNPRQSITEIAFDCGFYSSQHLANVFRKFTGVTPSGYRQHGAPELHLPRVQHWES